MSIWMVMVENHCGFSGDNQQSSGGCDKLSGSGLGISNSND